MQKVQHSQGSSHKYSIDITELCAQMSYFFVFPYSFDRKSKPEVANISPFVVTFREDSLTFVEILNRYLKLNPKEKRNSKLLNFTLPMGSLINRKMSVKNLKKQLRKDNIDGLNLYVIEIPEPKIKNKEDNELDNECGLMDFISESCYDRAKEFLFHFLLPQSTYIVTISINPNENISKLIEEFVDYLSRNYTRAIGANKFEQIRRQSIKAYYLMDGTNLQTLKAKDQSIHQCFGLYDGDYINVVMQQKKFTFTKVIHSGFPITLIKEESDKKRKTKILNIKYDEISDFTVENLYKVYFLSQEQRKFFEIETKLNKVCLKVLEYILGPDQTLKKLHKSIEKVKTLGEFKLVAYFITEKMVFYQHLLKLGNTKDFSINELKLVQSQQNKKQRKICEKNSQKFATERIAQLQKLSAEKHFKTSKEILPIVVYSSELEITNDETSEGVKFYCFLNNWLRLKFILKLKPHELEHWCMKFTSILYWHLSKIKTSSMKVYRGVSYLFEGKQNDKVTFKNFISTSADQNTAIGFAIKGHEEKKKNNPNQPPSPLVLMRIQTALGRSIEHFSVFPTEKQYLIEPFSEFRIMKKSEQQFGSNYLFTIYDLQQIASPRELPQTINNYILWVDDKPYEGMLIYNQLISQFRYPTVLFQIKSTQDLITWIQERSMIVQDTTKRMIMITNMVRQENGKPNYYAGIDAINVANTFITPNIPIALYVGNLQKAEENMKVKGCNCANVKLMNTFEELSKYVLQQKIGVKFINSKDDDVEIIVPEVQNNGNSGNESAWCEIM